MSIYVLEQAVPLRALMSPRTHDAVSVAGMTLTTVPPSSIVGAMLWAGYLGNIIVTHLNLIQA
jgi:hypothetical protein